MMKKKNLQEAEFPLLFFKKAEMDFHFFSNHLNQTKTGKAFCEIIFTQFLKT